MWNADGKTITLVLSWTVSFQKFGIGYGPVAIQTTTYYLNRWKHFARALSCTIYLDCVNLRKIHDLEACDYRRGMDWIFDLLTAYKHRLELHLITALFLITEPLPSNELIIWLHYSSFHAYLLLFLQWTKKDIIVNDRAGLKKLTIYVLGPPEHVLFLKI
jgi:hypothetical protein